MLRRARYEFTRCFRFLSRSLQGRRLDILQQTAFFSPRYNKRFLPTEYVDLTTLTSAEIHPKICYRLALDRTVFLFLIAGEA